ncbi:MAG: SCO family protein [Aquincola sp.]|nr:SCO family protein [Aquincola sp.]MDH5329858.1 SCO family protein [Aquincola sp.]
MRWIRPGLAAAGLALALTAGAHDDKPAGASTQKQPAAASQGPAAAPGTRDARAYFTDLELVTHDGRKVRFYSDMLEGRTVLINVIYTTCKDACPLITQKLNEVRALIGEQFGRDVWFVSLTSDPERDSPAALRSFAQKQSADLAGWTFLTGNPKHVEQILRKLGQYSQDAEDHSTLLIAGNVAAKRWAKIRPDAPPVAIAERLKLLSAGDGSANPLVR